MAPSAHELAERWRADLESWAIPAEIMAAAPESPWALPRRLYTRRAELRLAARPSGPSFEAAWTALDPCGSVLDVGAGGGAASLPLAARLTSLTAVDRDPELLGDLAGKASGLGVRINAVLGSWPEVSDGVEVADVVTCHHVLYNVPEVESFVAQLTAHARRVVVVEVTARHPLTALNPLWVRFHGLVRPEVPTADDLVALLSALGLSPSWRRWAPSAEPEHESFEDLVETTVRRLCLDKSRAQEVAQALEDQGIGPGHLGELSAAHLDLYAIWWAGGA